jgi:hypothetical protein
MKNFFNFKYGFIINSSGENVNREQKNDVYSNALAMKASNPMLANDPLFRQYLEDNNIPAFKISEEEMQRYMQMQQQGQPAQPQVKKDALMAQIDTQ